MTLVLKVNGHIQVIHLSFFEIHDLRNVQIGTTINYASQPQVLLWKVKLKEVWPQISRSSIKVTPIVLKKTQNLLLYHIYIKRYVD